MKFIITPPISNAEEFAAFAIKHPYSVQALNDSLKSSFEAYQLNTIEEFRDKNILPDELLMGYFFAAVAGPQLTITKSELNTCKTDFGKQYKGNSALFYTELEVTWEDFKSFAKNGVDPANLPNLALKFIHRYNATDKRWYLTAQKFNLEAAAPGSTTRPLKDLDSFFDILINETIKDNGKTGLTLTGTDYYDATYFAQVKDASGNLIKLGDHVSGSVFSWEEIQQLFCDNKKDESGADRDEANFTICFCSITSDYSTAPGTSRVKWPHTICMYLKYEGVELLDDGSTIVANIFRARGADYDTLCPPGCQAYTWPPLLGIKAPC